MVSSGRVPGKEVDGVTASCMARRIGKRRRGTRLASLCYIDEVEAMIGSKGREAEALPVEQVVGDGKGDPWTLDENAP